MKTYILLFVFSFIFFSCEDVLEEEPKSLAVETFYNTAEEVEAAVNAIYEPLRNNNCMGALYPAQHEAMPDYGFGRGSYAIISEYEGLNNTNITRVGQMWDLFYQSIRNANLVIDKVPQAAELSEEEKASFIGEAKFLRGLIYFIMVRNWGGIPIRTEANMEEANIQRNTEAEVYDLIQEDLASAENNLPETVSLSGKPTLWAAKSVLADVYLHLEQYTEAMNKANEVIQSGEYALVPVNTEDDFMNLYGPSVVNSSEEVFYLKYANTQGFFFVMFAHHPGAQLHGAGGYYAHYTFSDNPIIANWDENDLRKSYNLYEYDFGAGPTLLFKKFIDPSAPNASGAANDYPLYKFSDVLFIYAEAASRANNGPTPEAVEALNQVHRRAYGYDAMIPSPVDLNATGMSAEAFRDLVLQEKTYETMYEGKRWLDMKRVGKAQEIISNVKGITVDEKMLLWPIPNSELNYNTALTAADQNPGY